ncbi:hypothetical protein CDAR_70071 [Caerostris darwini]|uniref:Uncharacterized protein n=1 Tax=Caerostris darwini TaxID=1538125 RepID=A0AAV4TP72_9ARAC|nr:hypothetical protein CDAR_70071 [Caerostris darwini]
MSFFRPRVRSTYVGVETDGNLEWFYESVFVPLQAPRVERFQEEARSTYSLENLSNGFLMKCDGWKYPNVFMRVFSYPCTKHPALNGSTCTEEVARSTYTLENLSSGFLMKRGGWKPLNVFMREFCTPVRSTPLGTFPRVLKK